MTAVKYYFTFYGGFCRLDGLQGSLPAYRTQLTKHYHSVHGSTTSGLVYECCDRTDPTWGEFIRICLK